MNDKENFQGDFVTAGGCCNNMRDMPDRFRARPWAVYGAEHSGIYLMQKINEYENRFVNLQRMDTDCHTQANGSGGLLSGYQYHPEDQHRRVEIYKESTANKCKDLHKLFQPFLKTTAPTICRCVQSSWF